MPVIYETTLKAKSLTEVQGHVLKQHEETIDAFKLKGPFPVAVQKQRELRLSPNTAASRYRYALAALRNELAAADCHG